jgi:hypothetical protein
MVGDASAEAFTLLRSVAKRGSAMNRAALVISLLLAAPIQADDWKPAPSPLVTRWAKDVSPTKVHAEYPRPQMVREKWQNLNGLWQFAEAKANEAPPVGKNLDGRILVPFPVESALSGVGKRMERLWYRRTFSIPADWKGQRVLLHFGAVDWEAKIWVDGQELGEHRGGYDHFSFDVTDALKGDAEHELIVGVFDPSDAGYQPRGKQVRKPEGIWYTPSTGIWQTVWLEPVPVASIDSIQIVTDMKQQIARIVVTGRGTTDTQRVAVNVTFERKPGEFVMTGTLAGLGKTATINLHGETLRPWSPQSPFLYDLEVELQDKDGSALDYVKGYLAFRTIEVTKDGKGVPRVMLNGKPYFMVGPLDQGFWPDGLHTAPTDESLKFDIEMTKKLGFNSTRKHIKVEPERWYYYCDTLGLLVWQDMPSGDGFPARGQKEIKRSPESAKQYDLELKRMIDQLRNHPCIVMWVPFNEGWGQFDTVRVANWVKQYDPTRLVNNASGWNDMGAGDVNDVHVYPGPGAPRPDGKRASVLGEFGGLGLSLKGHLWNEKTWSYRGVADSADLTRQYERLLKRVYDLREKQGLNAAIYTQLTDVEVEANGLLTYDRGVTKVDVERVAAANRGDFSRMPHVEVVVPTAREQALKWRYTTNKPAGDWFKPEFDASAWKEGEAGFGTRMTPGSVVRTEWNTADIWLRRDFGLGDEPFDKYLLLMHHNEDAEVYLNGVLATRVRGFITDYDEFAINSESKKALKKGKNTIAIHCHQTTGGQYIDAGLGRVK